mgnify:CR=1 FL=1
MTNLTDLYNEYHKKSDVDYFKKLYETNYNNLKQ